MIVKCRNCGATYDNQAFICCPYCVRKAVGRNLTQIELQNLKPTNVNKSGVSWKPVLENFGIHSLSDTAEEVKKPSKKKLEKLASGWKPKKPHQPRAVDLFNKINHSLDNVAEKKFNEAIDKVRVDPKLSQNEKIEIINLINKELKYRKENLKFNKFIRNDGLIMNLPDADKVISMVQKDINNAFNVIKTNRMRYPLKEVVSTINIPVGLPKELENKILNDFIYTEKNFIENDLGRIVENYKFSKNKNYIKKDAKVKLEYGVLHVNEGTNYLASARNSQIKSFHIHMFYQNWNLEKKKWGWRVEGINPLMLKIIHQQHSQILENWINKNYAGILEYCNKEQLASLKQNSNSHLDIWDNKYQFWKEQARLKTIETVGENSKNEEVEKQIISKNANKKTLNKFNERIR